MARFWVYIGDKIQGPVDIPSLRKVPGFNLLTQVCPEGGETWRMADEVIEIKSYFLSPPRPNSFAIAAGNTAPKLDFLPKPDPTIKPEFEELTLPEPNTSWQNGTAEPVKKDQPQPAGGTALRAVCEVCGYKNPRDVAVCMKCGEKLSMPIKGPELAAKTPLSATPTLAPLPTVTPIPVPAPAPVSAAVVVEPPAGGNTMVEIPIMKLVISCLAAAFVAGGSFFAIRSWKKHHTPPAPIKVVPAPSPRSGKVYRTLHRVMKHVKRQPVVEENGNDDAAALPVVGKKSQRPVESTVAELHETPPASYSIVAEATPLKRRFSSPVNSPYAVKRRANQTLWTAQEEQAIKQVQQTRIYGGQRTIGRNVEILMQILRDREYTTAFDTGKRITLYNDVDWSATMKEGPVYEVHLTFSGGREADGSAKKPLHFTFNSDLERGTVEGGGQEQIRSNTLHAFFDESRIPPEERRAIAKDTEELVMAAQPESSPLALDTVVRQFAKVYTTASLTRVADAYNLTLVQKRLAHDPRLGSDEPTESGSSGQATKPAATSREFQPKPIKITENAPAVKPLPVSKGGPADFRMETGSGRERTVIVRAATKASVSRVWEIVTGYDRLKQFVPDMLASEREGQDGAAIIVHTVTLTRFSIFVFKLNLHLRVIEHPREHTLEFERIAGDFESFRGSFQLETDPATRDTLIGFHATLVPSGHVMNWVLEKVARRLLVTQIEAIRAKAESN